MIKCCMTRHVLGCQCCDIVELARKSCRSSEWPLRLMSFGCATNCAQASCKEAYSDPYTLRQRLLREMSVITASHLQGNGTCAFVEVAAAAAAAAARVSAERDMVRNDCGDAASTAACQRSVGVQRIDVPEVCKELRRAKGLRRARGVQRIDAQLAAVSSIAPLRAGLLPQCATGKASIANCVHDSCGARTHAATPNASTPTIAVDVWCAVPVATRFCAPCFLLGCGCKQALTTQSSVKM